MLTILGERVELAQIALSARAQATAVGLGAGLLAAATAAVAGLPGEIVAIVLLGISGWLLTCDAARRTITASGLARFAAANMLAAAGWLAVAGLAWLAGGSLRTSPVYDTVVHALTIGFTLSMILAHAPIILPVQSERVEHEAELAVVIGSIARNVPAEHAEQVIFGYTIANDVTARDLQKKDGQWSRAKGFDSFCPLGPWIETDLDPQTFADGVSIRTFLEGDVVQDGSTADMIFDIPELVAHVSSVMTLLPGDVILTGTPEGVGPMQVGDEVEISVAGIGSLINKVAMR